jgi:hypothetical protein
MGPQLRPTPRPSLTEPLNKLAGPSNSYEGTIRTLNPGNAPSFGGGIRSHLVGKTRNDMSWGLSSRAGAPNYMSTNRFIQYDRGFQPSEFKVFTGQPGSFNRYALDYAKNAYSHNNTSYR